MSLIYQVIKISFEVGTTKIQAYHKSQIRNFSIYFIIAVSMNHIYGVFVSEKACNHEVFYAFLIN